MRAGGLETRAMEGVVGAFRRHLERITLTILLVIVVSAQQKGLIEVVIPSWVVQEVQYEDLGLHEVKKLESGVQSVGSILFAASTSRFNIRIIDKTCDITHNVALDGSTICA
jgi:hypothetical protein